MLDKIKFLWNFTLDSKPSVLVEPLSWSSEHDTLSAIFLWATEMINMQIEKIPTRILSAVRQRLGADDGNDKSYDLQISRLQKNNSNG